MTNDNKDRGGHPPAVHFRLFLAYLSVFVIWGSTYLAIRVGVRDIPPALFAGVRFLAAGSVMGLYGMARGRRVPRGDALRTSIFVGILLLAGGNGMVVWSEQWIHSGLAAVIIASVPLFMSSMDALIPGGHRLSLAGWLGILIGFGGVVILVSPTFRGISGIQPAGIAGLLVASFFWSAGSVYWKRKAVGGDLLMNTSLQMLGGGLFLLAIALAAGEGTSLQFTQGGILALLYLIVFGSIIGFTSYTYLLHHVPPAKASTYAYVNPVIAVILGTFFLDEPLELLTVIAATVILGGVAIVQTATMKQTDLPAG